MSISRSVRLSVCLSVYLFVCVSDGLYVYLSASSKGSLCTDALGLRRMPYGTVASQVSREGERVTATGFFKHAYTALTPRRTSVLHAGMLPPWEGKDRPRKDGTTLRL